jgi:copper chaperone
LIRLKKEVPKMAENTFSIPNISCGHCVRAIEGELQEMDGVLKVSANAENKTAMVEWEPPATLDAIKDKLKEINYPAE